MTRLVPLFLLIAVLVAVPAASFGAVAFSVTIAPPALPVYAQPLCPGPGYIWTPGYWAYGVNGYYWVPGAWILAPYVGALWTPGYWGWADGVYLWHAGYWGRHVGFYGGINYGFGYPGVGYQGGYWNRGSFFYNSAVNHVNRTAVHNVYSRPVANRDDRVSFNGGHGGTRARPTAAVQARLRQPASSNPRTLAASRSRASGAHRAVARQTVHTNPQTAHTNHPIASHPTTNRSRTRAQFSRPSNTRAANRTAARPARSTASFHPAARRNAVPHNSPVQHRAAAPPSHAAGPTHAAQRHAAPARGREVRHG